MPNKYRGEEPANSAAGGDYCDFKLLVYANFKCVPPTSFLDSVPEFKSTTIEVVEEYDGEEAAAVTLPY